jgi:hypothetical protein
MLRLLALAGGFTGIKKPPKLGASPKADIILAFHTGFVNS